MFTLCLLVALSADPVEPGNAKQRDTQFVESLARDITALTESIAAAPKTVSLYSRRGDAWFFSGKFAEAVADYSKMIDLQPDLETSHWRRGIALFYAGQYDLGAKQFEVYHNFDNVDRENGIWRYLCQHKAYGRAKAREGLLKYAKDDREPFPAVYKLFSVELSREEVLQAIEAAKIDGEERDKRLFYARLYIGLNEFVEGRLDSAREHLAAAATSEWARKAGGGPGYMRHVARVHVQTLTDKAPNPR